MAHDMEEIEADIDRVAGSERRLLDAIASLEDGDARRPSLLPGWSVAHLLTHLARNADSHTRRAEAAIRNELVGQYEGGSAGREAEIEAGSARSASELVADVKISSATMLETWAKVPPESWAVVSHDVSGRSRQLWALPYRRWLESEIHMVDLGIGITYQDWPDDFVVAGLAEMRPGAEARLGKGESLPPPGLLDPKEELAWLYGRLSRDDLPRLKPWS